MAEINLLRFCEMNWKQPKSWVFWIIIQILVGLIIFIITHLMLTHTFVKVEQQILYLKNKLAVSQFVQMQLKKKAVTLPPHSQHFNHLNLQNVKVQDALFILAKRLKQNIIVSSQITGNLMLHIQNMQPLDLFNFILTSQGLVKYEKNHIWFIVPKRIMADQKVEEWKQQEILRETEPLAIHVWQIHYAKVQNIAHLIQDGNHTLLSKRGYLQLDERSNKLYIRDTIKNLDIVAALIKQMDIPIKQVLIEARLVSVDCDFERNLGIQYLTSNTPVASLGNYSMAIAKLANGSLLDIQLAALENEGHAELISSPSLFTANQQTASIESGEEIPYQEVSSSGGTGVAFKKAVLSLQVTPQILPNEEIQLQLQVNQDRASTHTVLGVPTITTRQLTSHVLVHNGQTIVLGGIFETSSDQTSEKIPYLNQIPMIGLLFQQQNKHKSKRKLLIFITPKIKPF